MKQREIQQFFSIRNAESVDGEMFLEGISEPGAPNKRGLMLDAATSWPYIEAYIAEFEARTDGASKGALRAMHDERREVGKIVDVDLSQSPAIPVRVHVVSDEAKKSVEARVLNAFSWNWAVVGSMWEDKEASEKFGRRVMKYTGRPIELSLVDAPGIPETGFHVVANFDEGEDMSEPVPAPAEKPEAAPEQVENAGPAQPETVANGLYTAGRFGEALEGLAYIQRVIAGEESAEGDTTEIPDDLKAAISEVAKVYAKYAAAQAAELIEEGEDFDLISRYEELEEAFEDDLSEGVENGDYPGHPFRGNQHKKGKRGGSAQHQASRAAARMSSIAKKLGGGAHASAAMNHSAAAKAAKAAGKSELAKYHEAKAAHHTTQHEVHKASKVKNGEEATAAVQNSDASEILSALAKLTERIAALEVSNSDKPAAPAPAPAPIAVLHDEEQVTNGDTAPRTPAPIRYQDHSGKSLEQIRQSVTQH